MKQGVGEKKGIGEFVQYLISIIVVCLIVFLSVAVYSRVSESQKENNQSRKELAYIVNKVKANDEDNSVAVKKGKYGDTLVITDKTEYGNFQTRIYEHNGKLYEEYVEEKVESNYNSGTEITKVSNFDIRKTGAEITIATDGGSAVVTLRSEE